MTPHQLDLVGQASREMNRVKVRNLLDEFCHASAATALLKQYDLCRLKGQI